MKQNKLLLHRFKSLIEEKTKWFVGRTYVFDAIQSFINNNPNGYFTIIGDPGQGKSAILAKYVQNTGCVAHFNVQLQGINRADQFLESVCRQLAIRYDLPYDPLPPKATQDGEFLSQLLEEVARKAEGQPVVIAVDALDEVDSASYREANILYLPPQLPDGIYFILTRRRVEVPLTVYVPTQSLSLLDEQYQADSERDVRTYIQNRIDDSNILRQRIDERQESVPDFINKLTERSENNFMYLRYILTDIESGLYKDLDLEDFFPLSLNEYYEFRWRRMGMMNQPLLKENIKFLAFLTQIPDPVSSSFLAYLMSEEQFTVEKLFEEWKEFLSQNITDNQVYYTIFHKSFRDFYSTRKSSLFEVENLFSFSPKNIHAMIANQLLEKLFGKNHSVNFNNTK
jgi:serine/threonine-protein kinase